jgi:hypothetical protein
VRAGRVVQYHRRVPSLGHRQRAAIPLDFERPPGTIPAAVSLLGKIKFLARSFTPEQPSCLYDIDNTG